MSAFDPKRTLDANGNSFIVSSPNKLNCLIESSLRNGGVPAQRDTMTTYLQFVYCLLLGLASFSLIGTGETSAQTQNRAFQFGLIGDMP
jgi:hypothetical protein